MTIRPVHLWGRTLLFGGGALTSLLMGWTGSGTLQAQPENTNPSSYTQSAPQTPRNFLSKSLIQLPIRIDDASRAKIQEIQLWIKDNPSAPWTFREKVGASQTAFTIQVPRDGEYWFTMVTVDKQGHSFPSDLRNEPPGLSVVIDTQPPQVEFLNLGSTPEGLLIQCDVSDSNLDSTQTRFFFQGGDGNYRPIDALPGRGNVFCVPTQAVFTGFVRVMAQDLAKNQTQREIHVDKMTARSAGPVNPQQQQVLVPNDPPKTHVIPEVVVMPPTSLPNSVLNKTPNLVPLDPPTAQKLPSGPIRPDGSDGPRLPDHKSGSSPIVTEPPVRPLPTTTVETAAMKRQIVNSTKVFLDYQIENAGESGVGKVEVWITRDQAKSWTRLSEDKQRKSPVEVQFPGDGLFGVTLVASNGRGAGGATPAAGDTPDWWIEVDTTKPTAQITKVHSVTEEGNAQVHIHWTASDKNLGETPVDVFYAASPQGPWLPIAKGLKAEGQHRWSPPRDIGAQAHIQLSVRDLAGNTSLVQTLVPVLFDDPARPRAVIRGITTGTPTTMGTPTATPLPLQIVQPAPGPR
jgi:hypothetical protein